MLNATPTARPSTHPHDLDPKRIGIDWATLVRSAAFRSRLRDARWYATIVDAEALLRSLGVDDSDPEVLRNTAWHVNQAAAAEWIRAGREALGLPAVAS
jgi:hypothetical protein